MRHGRAYQVVSVTVRSPLPIARVLMGFELDQPVLNEVEGILGLDITLAVRNGSAWQALGTTLTESLLPAVLGALPEELMAETRHFTLLMAAGSVLVKRLPDAHVDKLLVDTTRLLIPPQHRENLIEKRILSLSNRNLLDQPPGEIERTIHGLQRRRADRLHRAWLRGFFVPRGVELAG